MSKENEIKKQRRNQRQRERTNQRRIAPSGWHRCRSWRTLDRRSQPRLAPASVPVAVAEFSACRIVTLSTHRHRATRLLRKPKTRRPFLIVCIRRL